METQQRNGEGAEPSVTFCVVNSKADAAIALEIQDLLLGNWSRYNLDAETSRETNFSLQPLMKAENVIVVWSNNSLSAESVRTGLETAVKEKKRIAFVEVERRTIPEEFLANSPLVLKLEPNSLNDSNPSARWMDLYWALLPFLRMVQPQPLTGRQIWEKLDWVEQLFSIGVIAFLLGLFFVLLPRFTAPYVAKTSQSQAYTVKITILQPIDTSRELSGELRLRSPSTVKLNETKTVEADLFFPENYSSAPLAAKLASPSFTITPEGETTTQLHNDLMSWSWLISPKQIGQHALSLNIKHATFSPIQNFEGLKVQGDALIAEVTTVDDLGLSSTQRAILRAAGVVVGVIGSILAYPLWKHFFQWRLAKTDRIEPPSNKKRKKAR